MKFIEEFGFKIYRLKDERAESEFLIYDLEKDIYSQYSKSRLVPVLKTEIRDKDIDLNDFINNILNNEGRNYNINKILDSWIFNEVILINSIGYKPTNERIFERDSKIYFNSFICPATMKKENYILEKPMTYEELKEKAPYHHKLFMNLHNKDENAIKDTLMKLADKIQFPAEKAQDCLVFFPGEAAGKGIFYKHILQPIFGKYSRKTLMKKLNSDFNGFLKEPLVLVLEEGKRDLELVETLKEAITEGTMLINEKGKNQEEKEVFFLTFVFSNHMNPIDLGKRRGSYHLTHSLGKDEKESQLIGAEICKNLPNETIYLLQYLHNLEFNHQDALMPYGTNAKTLVNDLNKSPIETFYDYLMSFDTYDRALGSLVELYELQEYIKHFKPRKAEEGEFIAKEIYKEAYNQWCIKENLRNNIIRHNKDIVQLWALMKIGEDSHQRIEIKEGKFSNRKLDFIRLSDIVTHYKEVKEE